MWQIMWLRVSINCTFNGKGVKQLLPLLLRSGGKLEKPLWAPGDPKIGNKFWKEAITYAIGPSNTLLLNKIFFFIQLLLLWNLKTQNVHHGVPKRPTGSGKVTSFWALQLVVVTSGLINSFPPDRNRLQHHRLCQYHGSGSKYLIRCIRWKVQFNKCKKYKVTSIGYKYFVTFLVWYSMPKMVV